MSHDPSELRPAATPGWIWPPFRVCEHRLQAELRYLHLAMRGLRQLRVLPRLMDVLATVSPGDTKDNEMDAAKQDAEWVAGEADGGFPLLHAHSVVGIWSALEVLCEDFAIAWLSNTAAAWAVPEVAKLKIAVGQYQQLQAEERPRFVVGELARSQAADLRKGVGKLKALLGVFGLAPTVGPNVQKALHELCQVRNAIVHCGGLADRKLLDECPWLDAAVGAEVRIPHALYGWYYQAAQRYAERVSNQALMALGLPSCKCPGLDEIKPRPKIGGHAAQQRDATDEAHGGW